jgi:hypothetical protein
LAGSAELRVGHRQAGPAEGGRRHGLELSGERQALTVYLRASRGDVYAAGAALGAGQQLKDKSGAAIDLAFALYGRP